MLALALFAIVTANAAEPPGVCLVLIKHKISKPAEVIVACGDGTTPITVPAMPPRPAPDAMADLLVMEAMHDAGYRVITRQVDPGDAGEADVSAIWMERP